MVYRTDEGARRPGGDHPLLCRQTDSRRPAGAGQEGRILRPLPVPAPRGPGKGHPGQAHLPGCGGGLGTGARERRGKRGLLFFHLQRTG